MILSQDIIFCQFVFKFQKFRVTFNVLPKFFDFHQDSTIMLQVFFEFFSKVFALIFFRLTFIYQSLNCLIIVVFQQLKYLVGVFFTDIHIAIVQLFYEHLVGMQESVH
ncbi:hypothetical protein BMS3Abin10_02105 [bacterium BMS3Abin10]|nr:hypothetical protein BMS3Abin10_02105 [bacterium BMS3Abin10]